MVRKWQWPLLAKPPPPVGNPRQGPVVGWVCNVASAVSFFVFAAWNIPIGP